MCLKLYLFLVKLIVHSSESFYFLVINDNVKKSFSLSLFLNTFKNKSDKEYVMKKPFIIFWDIYISFTM